jgi:hypothetical protein
MYTKPAPLLLGFHGCDRRIGEQVLSGSIQHLRRSENDFDWLGHGVYFWESNPDRAFEFAQECKAKPRQRAEAIDEPYVVGAIIDPGTCLNLLESKSLREVREAFALLRETLSSDGTPLPENMRDKRTGQTLKHNLDCAVIEMLHSSTMGRPYDTVRGAFVEGPPLYPGSEFHQKNHIQICVRNTACIKGYFRLLPEL